VNTQKTKNKYKGHSTTNEDHGPICHDINVFHPDMFLLLSQDRMPNDAEKLSICCSASHLVSERNFLGIEETNL